MGFALSKLVEHGMTLRRGSIVLRGRALDVVWSVSNRHVALMPVGKHPGRTFRPHVALDSVPGFGGRDLVVRADILYRVRAYGLVYEVLSVLPDEIVSRLAGELARAQESARVAIKWGNKRERALATKDAVRCAA